MGHAIKTPPASVLEEATDKMLAVLEEHLSKFSPAKQQEKWDGLEEHLKDAASETRAKPQGRRSKRRNSRRSPSTAIR